MLSQLSKSYSAKVGFRFPRDWAPVQVQSLELRLDFKITDHENRDSNRTPNSISSSRVESSLSHRRRVLFSSSKFQLKNPFDHPL
ncbi:hypothetical protein AVEN_269480-1 [Araneus ventricosus]|uniref:Uncharacterized protein n=1 Tax=Araneus ventricosus TaxID=182803 RepID=A0A4Y2R8J0_ARAVE|nr:hypothetical protein AVEN_19611-1 [Araneus ventricosus]GBN72077.1 hypothetical protein AVEN_269480-1 [Araneus ventricosus]